jgi:hypothetical protein
VTSIGGSAFYRCSSLTSVIIPEGVTSIGGSAFYRCSSLTSVIIPKGVTSIGDYAFDGCENLVNLEIPNSVVNIGNSVFSGCQNLEQVEDNIVYVDCWVVEVYYPLYTVVVLRPDTIGISSQAFDVWDGGPTSIFIPDTLRFIGNDAFGWCSSLADVYYGGTKEQWSAITIGEDNSPLLEANIHFNCEPGNGSAEP